MSGLLLGGRELGEQLVDDPRIALLSATGSVRMGQQVGPRVAARFGRALLELGGNNAAIVTPSADLDLAVRGIVFAAAGTAGQRCTSLRRLIVHRSVADLVVNRVVTACKQLPIGDPSAPGILVGPADSRDGLSRHGGCAWSRRAPTAARSSAESATQGGRPERLLRRARRGPDAIR